MKHFLEPAIGDTAVEIPLAWLEDDEAPCGYRRQSLYEVDW